MIIIGVGYAIQIDKKHPAYTELMLLDNNISLKKLEEFCREKNIDFKLLPKED